MEWSQPPTPAESSTFAELAERFSAVLTEHASITTALPDVATILGDTLRRNAKLCHENVRQQAMIKDMVMRRPPRCRRPQTHADEMSEDFIAELLDAVEDEYASTALEDVYVARLAQQPMEERLSNNVAEQALPSTVRQEVAREVLHGTVSGTLRLDLVNGVTPNRAPHLPMAINFGSATESRTSCFGDTFQEAAHQPWKHPTKLSQPNDMTRQLDMQPATSTLQPDGRMARWRHRLPEAQKLMEEWLPNNVAQQALSSPVRQGAVRDVSHGVSLSRTSQLSMGLGSNTESRGSCFVDSFQEGGLQIGSQLALVPEPKGSFIILQPGVRPGPATLQSHLCEMQSMEPETAVASQRKQSGSTGRTGKRKIEKVAVLLPVGLITPATVAELSVACAASAVLPSMQLLPATPPLPVGSLLSTASSSGDWPTPSSASAPADTEVESMAYAQRDGAIPEVTTSMIAHISDGITTVIIRHIPSQISQAQLLQMWPVRDVGYNMLHAPFNNRKRRCMGYAFMNFTSHRALLEFHGNWNGAVLEDGPEPSGLIIEAAKLQGLEANIQQMRCSKLIKSIRRSWHMPIIVLADGTFADFRQVMAETNFYGSMEGADGDEEE